MTQEQIYTIAANSGAIGDSCITDTEIQIENPNGILFIDNYYILEYTKTTD